MHTEVEVTLDVMCAASYVAYARFQRAAARFRAGGGELEVRFLPFQLAPDASTVGEPIRAVHRRMFGPDADHETDRFARVAARDGVVLDYDRVLLTNTFEAHRLIGLAADVGLAEATVERLFRAYFTEGENLGDAATLQRLAAEVGVPWSARGADRTRAALAEVARSGVRSIPVFAFSGGVVLGGTRSESEFDAALAAAAGVTARV
jgi:predicted DsbA family dithiol-disulfide isomerase